MTTHSLSAIKAAGIAKDTEEKRQDSREKAMLLFAFQLLLEKGYVDTAASLATECSLNLEQYSICENIDLSTIFIDFEAYYSLRFQKHPQYFKKLNTGSAVGESLLAKLARQHKNGGAKPQRRGLIVDTEDGSGPGSNSASGSNSNSVNFEVNLTNLSLNGLDGGAGGSGDRLLKPISGLEFANEDMRYFAEIIQKDIVKHDLETKWDDIIGLDDAKMILLESMVYRDEFSAFFGKTIPPWRGLLLYGAPGTGKTLLAKAVASECGTTFFNISSASIISKWRGDSEKILRVLFDLARHHAPSTIFFDEFDSLASNRDTSGESDASRRLKSELLQQIDGLLSTTQPDKPVFILAATNLPWELDLAILRRMEKRVFIPMPNEQERKEILELHFAKTAKGIKENSKGRNCLELQLNFDHIAQASKGYSGSDLQQIVKETIVVKFRESFKTKIKKLIMTTDDVLQTIYNVKPTVNSEALRKFVAWDGSFKAK